MPRQMQMRAPQPLLQRSGQALAPSRWSGVITIPPEKLLLGVPRDKT